MQNTTKKLLMLRKLPLSVLQVGSLDEVFNENFTPWHNVILHRRRLRGSFAGVAKRILEIASERNFFTDAVSTYRDFDDATCYLPLDEIFKRFKRDKLTPSQGQAVARIHSDVDLFESRGYRVDLRVQTHVYKTTAPKKVDSGAHTDDVYGRIMAAYCGTTTLGWSIEDAGCDEWGQIARQPDMSRAFPLVLGAVWKQAGIAAIPNGIPPFVHVAAAATPHTPRMFIVADKYQR